MEGYSVRIDSICICYVGSTLLFVAIVSITLLYNRFLCRAVIAAKYISIIILSGLVVLEFLGEINNGIGISIMKREYALSSLNIVSFVSNNLIRFSAVQLLVTVAVSGLFFKFAYGKVFYRTRDRYAISFGKTRVFSKRYGTRNPVVVFFIRDITCLFRDTSFAMLQLVYIVAAFVLFYMPAHSYNGLHLLVFVGAIFTNSFFIQALYKIDAAFISAYRKIPMTFSQFLVARICNAALISLLIPVLLLTCSFMLGRTSLRLYAIFSLILIVSSLILCAYWSSVILPFFPNINKFDIPLMVGFVVLIAAIPLLLIPKLSVIYFLIITIIIGVGVKRGSKIWRKVIREC
jgi:predicted permease